jgi:hypothetical protein
MKQKYIITIELGTNFQAEVVSRLMNETLKAIKYSVESRHKKNKFEIIYEPENK